MASIRKEIDLDVPPGEVWDAVRDAGSVHRRLMPGFIAEAHLVGDTRSCTMADGSPLRELIVDVDDETRRFVYAIVEAPLPMTHHSASMQVFANGEGGTRFVWVSDFLPNDLAGPIGELLEGAAANIRETLSAPTVSGHG